MKPVEQRRPSNPLGALKMFIRAVVGLTAVTGVKFVEAAAGLEVEATTTTTTTTTTTGPAAGLPNCYNSFPVMNCQVDEVTAVATAKQNNVKPQTRAFNPEDLACIAQLPLNTIAPRTATRLADEAEGQVAKANARANEAEGQVAKANARANEAETAAENLVVSAMLAALDVSQQPNYELLQRELASARQALTKALANVTKLTKELARVSENSERSVQTATIVAVLVPFVSFFCGRVFRAYVLSHKR